MLFNIALKKKRNSTTGRSMVEILGVLAVIGILSLAALSGLSYLKEKNIANQITKEAITQASEIKARARQHVDSDTGEILYARSGEGLYISSRRYGAEGVGKTSLILSAMMRSDDGNFTKISKSLCQKLISKEKVGIFDCILADESATTCPTSEDADVSCKEDNVIVFITDATTTTGGNTVDACKNVTCTGNRVCIAGVCQCQEGYHEEDGECERCGDPKEFCHLSDEQLSMIDTNGCPVFKKLNCDSKDCNLITGECCSESEKYDATAQLCCLPAKRLTACDSEVSSSLGECSYYQGCIDSTCYTEYDNDGECCSNMNTSETCCYAVHIKDNPTYYTASNVKKLLSYNPNDTTQKCQCVNDYADKQGVCCKDGEYNSKGYCCPNGQEYNETAKMCCGTATKANACDTRVDASEGICPYYKKNCENKYCNITTKKCCSTDKKGMKLVASGGKCVCPSKYEMCGGVCRSLCNKENMTGNFTKNCTCECTSGFKYQEDGTCVKKCGAGYTLGKDGVCRRFNCQPTSESGFFQCFIDGKRCANYCPSAQPTNWNDCFGSCSQYSSGTKNYCPSGTSYEEYSMWAGSGCKYKDKVYCAYSGKKYEGIWRCINKNYDDNDHRYCCRSAGKTLSCDHGTCTPSDCDVFNNKEKGQSSTYEYNVSLFLGGCKITRNGSSAYCVPTKNSKGENFWRCFLGKNRSNTKSEEKCADCTASKLKAGTGCGECFKTPTCEGGTWNKETKRCDYKYNGYTVGCSFSNRCYIGNKMCCYLDEGVHPKYCDGGRCSKNAPGKIDINKGDCSNEFTYNKQLGVYGCQKDTKDKKGKLFFRDGTMEGYDYACYFTGTTSAGKTVETKLCGSGCDANCTSCDIPYMKECSFGKCLSGEKVDGCTCSTPYVKTSDGYCCPKGHVYLNGACSLNTCQKDKPYLNLSDAKCYASCPKGTKSDKTAKTCKKS